jgi:hypothetical protein
MRISNAPRGADRSETVTLAEAALTLGVSEEAVRRLVAAGQLSGRRVRGLRSRGLRIDRGAVVAYGLLRDPLTDGPGTRLPEAPGRRTAPPSPSAPATGARGSRIPEVPEGVGPTRRSQNAQSVPRVPGERSPGRGPAPAADHPLDLALAENVLLQSHPQEPLNLALEENPFLQGSLLEAEPAPARRRRRWWPW